MKKSFSEILQDHHVVNVPSVEINGITTNLQDAAQNECVFYNFKTESDIDIQKFKERRELSKARIVFVNSRKVESVDGVVFVGENDFKSLLDSLVNCFYPLPAKLPTCIGITGTNGKTTTVQFITNILHQNGFKAISIGTIGVCDHTGAVISPTSMTTPGYEVLRKIIFKFQNMDYLVFEVSSHSLDQERFKGLEFDFAGWTNFTQDHLDYHKSMENYFKSKKKILEKLKFKKIVLPSSQVDLSIKIGSQDTLLARKLDENLLNRLPEYLKIEFNLENLELAIGVVELAIEQCKINPSFLSMPTGRIDSINRKEGYVFIDYAHTPDALERVLKSLKKAFPKRPLWLVFGCGGNRDKTKRSIMGQIAFSFSDEFIVTSDNPRDENPATIIEDIILNLESGTSVIERREAINKALVEAPTDAIILIAGKGHEDYQEIRGKRYKFSDKETVLEILEILK